MLSAPAFSTSINSPESASKYLADHFLLMTNQDLDHPSLSHALLHLTFTSSITTPAADAIRAIVILSDSLIPPPTTPAPTTPQQIANPESLESQISLLGTYVEALCEVTALNTSSASVITWVIDDVKDDLHNTVQYMSTTADELVEAAKNTPSLHPTPPPQAFSYADATEQKLPTIAAAKCLVQTKMVRISPPLDDPSASLKDLDEDVLVQKANTALELVHIDDPTIPEEVQFVSARKTNHGQVLYEVDSSQTADWLCLPDGAKAFTSKFGPNVMLATKLFSVLIEYVPIHFNTDDPSYFKIESRINQGCPLSALAFLFYNADILDIPNRKNGEAGTGFIDDIVFVAHSPTFPASNCKIQVIMERQGGCLEWSCTHHVSF